MSYSDILNVKYLVRLEIIDPLYKRYKRPINQVQYNPITWAEWTKTIGITANSLGLEMTSDGSTWIFAHIPTSLKVSTKYGLLYNIVNATITQNFLLGTGLNPFNSVIPKTIGNNKFVITTLTSFSYNQVQLGITNTDSIGNKIKLKDIRLFELPTSSQIETDFTSLTADQLNTKYPF